MYCTTWFLSEGPEVLHDQGSGEDLSRRDCAVLSRRPLPRRLHEVVRHHGERGEVAQRDFEGARGSGERDREGVQGKQGPGGQLGRV